MVEIQALLQCESCNLEFDLGERIPKLMPCCGTTLCLNCIIVTLPNASEHEVEAGYRENCKKCISCAQLIVLDDPAVSLHANNQIVKILTKTRSPFVNQSLELGREIGAVGTVDDQEIKSINQ